MTTNYENSKKLAEIGFVGKSETWKHDPDNFITGQKYWSYDLETLLDALPEYVGNEILFFKKNGLFYGYEARLHWTKKQENESLTDTAARLLILLAQQKIINFK